MFIIIIFTVVIFNFIKFTFFAAIMEEYYSEWISLLNHSAIRGRLDK